MCTENAHSEDCQAKLQKIKDDIAKEDRMRVAKAASSDLIPRAVIDAIIKAWPDQAVEILSQLQFSGDHFSFTRWGMYVGVEFDGYIHT